MWADVGVQIGLGPWPPPAPLPVISRTVPKVNRPSTMTVVVMIHPTWTPRLVRASAPPTGSGAPCGRPAT